MFPLKAWDRIRRSNLGLGDGRSYSGKKDLDMTAEEATRQLCDKRPDTANRIAS
jgi:hypothetical protein